MENIIEITINTFDLEGLLFGKTDKKGEEIEDGESEEVDEGSEEDKEEEDSVAEVNERLLLLSLLLSEFFETDTCA